MRSVSLLLGLTLIAGPSALYADEVGMIKRIDANTVELHYAATAGDQVWLSKDTVQDKDDTKIEAAFQDGKAQIALASGQLAYVIVTSDDREPIVFGERVLPLEQASNFRDVGGYTTKDGQSVKWGKVYRSGAMPLLTEDDYHYIDQLGLDSIVDFRSLEEREVTPNMVDDRTGALFIANDYSMAPMMAAYRKRQGENTYSGMEAYLRPQYRSVFKRILADDGAVLYHCSAGQDRTGVATALLYDVLGVDRETIVKDYHLSTELRKTEWEMPDINPEDYPGNFIVQYYVAARQANEGPKPLYTPSGESHLVQFFDYIDAEYGSSEGYLKQVLALSDADIAKLRELMLN